MTLQSSSRGKDVPLRLGVCRIASSRAALCSSPILDTTLLTTLSSPIDLTLGAEGRRGSRVERRESLEANLQLAHSVLDDTKLDIVDASWLSDDTLLCGSAEGRVRGAERRMCLFFAQAVG